MNLFYFFVSFILAIFVSFLVSKLAYKINILDIPKGERKIHLKPTPLLGGLAIFIVFFLIAFLAKDSLLAGDLKISHWLGVFIGAIILVAGGILDDKYNLKPQVQFIFPILAILAVIGGGVEISKITNPTGGYLYLDQYKFNLFSISGMTFSITIVSDIFIFLWLMGMMYTTKLLDGIDGLVSGVASIGAIIIFLFTITPKYYQADIATASLILAGASFGFLVLNWHPAKIFLGEGGSLLLGFLLGVLAVISGGKIAIALLIMGLPILDVFWTIVRRLINGKNPFKFSDRKHLHHKLLDLGLSQRQVVMVFYFFSSLFGLSALFLQSIGKIYALAFLVLVMIAMIAGLNIIEKRKICK